MKCKWQEERSPTFSLVGTEGVLLAVFPTGSFFSCVRDFTELSRDGKVALGTGVAPRVAVSIEAPVREKIKHVELTRGPKMWDLLICSSSRKL